MGQKTFQQILDEQMESETKAPNAPEKEWRAPNAEFDLSVLRNILPKQMPKTKAMSAYPKAVQPPKPKPRPKDKFLEVANLSAAEFAALQAFGMKTESLLSKNELKTKYRALVRKLHPDHHPVGIDENDRSLLTEKFHLVHEAYGILDQAFSRQIPKQ